MANLNRWQGIGRLTRDVETTSFQSGGKVARFGFAVNNRRRNQQTGEYEDEPCFLDVEAFNRPQNASGGGRQLADLCAQSLAKGHLAYIEGHLRMDQWTDDSGQKRQKIKVVLDDVQFLQPKDKDPGIANPAQRPQRSQRPQTAASGSPPARSTPNTQQSIPDDDDSIPF
jgi:single-strand DNA-binding protein